MKFLKVLLIILVVLAVLVGILTAIAPTKIEISRSAIINAPKEVVWSNVSMFSNINQWSPWNKKDPEIKVSIEGTDGTVGAISSWEGNKDVGKGSQEIISLENNKRMESKLRFKEPFESEANAYFDLKDTTGGVFTTWGFTTTMPRPMNIVGLFMDMDKAVGADFEAGLVNLKARCEEQAAATKLYRGYQVNSEELPARTFIGHREVVSWADMQHFYSDNLSKIFKDITMAKIELAGAASGLYYKWDTIAQQADMAVAVPVKGVTSAPKGWELFNVEAGSGLEVDYYGGYNKMSDPHNAIGEYMKEKGINMAPKIVVEEYISDPTVEKDTSKWLTKIYYYL